MRLIDVTRRQVLAARLQMELDRQAGRPSHPRVVALADAQTATQAISETEERIAELQRRRIDSIGRGAGAAFFDTINAELTALNARLTALRLLSEGKKEEKKEQVVDLTRLDPVRRPSPTSTE